jgi:hypothetical protein
LFDRFFRPQPLLDEASKDWLLNAYAWSLRHFDSDLFFRHSHLVLPDNDHFPGRADSVEAMAELIFKQVKDYAGMGHWPIRLAHDNACNLPPAGALQLTGPLRAAPGQSAADSTGAATLWVGYDPQQLNNPEGIIASFAHHLAHYLGQMSPEAPPGGLDYWPHATELLAIFFGFGVMFSNSAFTFRGGCGSCYNPRANRNAYLSEREATYALAIFCQLKGIAAGQVTGHLKKHLRGFFRKACRQLAGDATLSRLLPQPS